MDIEKTYQKLYKNVQKLVVINNVILFISNKNTI